MLKSNDAGKQSLSAHHSGKPRDQISLFLAKRLEDLVGVFGDVYFVENLGDLPVFVNQECLAVGAHVLFAVHRFFAPYLVLLHYIFIGVGDECIGQIELRDKFLMRLFVVDRYSDDRNVFLIEFVARITERTRFFGSARCVVFWIEPKHDAFATVIFQTDGIAVLIFGCKVGSFVAFF